MVTGTYIPQSPEPATRYDPEMHFLLGVPAMRLTRRWRLLYLMIGTALLGICAYTLLLFSIVTPTQLERTVRGLRAVPNDFVQESNTKKEFITAGDEKIIVDTIAAVDGLRFEFNRQQQETPVGWMEWLSAPLSLARDALPVSSARKYPSCGLSEADKMRYTSLKRGGRIFIAINLLDNEELMPTLTRELLALLRELGPDRFFVSIYENGSMDLTVMQLRLLCKVSLHTHI